MTKTLTHLEHFETFYMITDSSQPQLSGL